MAISRREAISEAALPHDIYYHHFLLPQRREIVGVSVKNGRRNALYRTAYLRYVAHQPQLPENLRPQCAEAASALIVANPAKLTLRRGGDKHLLLPHPASLKSGAHREPTRVKTTKMRNQYSAEIGIIMLREAA